MFIVSKKRRQFGFIDAVCELLAESVRTGSLKPLSLLFKKGHFGHHGCMYGSYVKYRRYLDKIGESEKKQVIITN